ncbi:hypothetical protein AB0B89_36005 [Sphaerisporangium sp. NPDC049002]|uniref:hypothetical protein n=1 Tax=Sphaerisporangium sp. NPDC049002 TaxID=3155392 RepID=UPI0033D7D85A
MNGPIESKVKAATAAATVSGFLVWLLGVYVFGGNVPLPVQALISLVVPAALTYIAGWQAPHTARTDPTALAAGDKPQ